MRRLATRRQVLKAGVAALAVPAARAFEGASLPSSAAREWRHYGGDAGASRFSPLSQINRGNVGRLKIAWTHRTGDALERPLTTIECTPIVVDSVMYLTTARVQIRALNAATGKILWNYDPFASWSPARRRGISRGVAYWNDGERVRILATFRDALLCLDARTGEPVRDFGDNGVVDLKQEFDHDMTGLSFLVTSPPVIYKDMVIVGGGGGEGPRPAAPGHIRAYDVHTGKRRWIFHTVPHPGEFGHETWKGDSWKTTGGANNWAGMCLDAGRGVVYASTGCATFDFFGGSRPGDNLFANCVLGLEAETGKRLWHFQTIHHDVWDYDLPAQPVLVRFPFEGRLVDAVAQVTKTGMLFLLDRDTGAPIFPVDERPVPQSAVEREQLSATQPFPTKPPPFARQGFTDQDATNVSAEARAHVLAELKTLRSEGLFTPPSIEGSVLMPGTLGGALWGGGSFDPDSGRLFVNSSALPSIVRLVPAKPDAGYPYDIKGYERFLDPDGYPAVKPPWGELTAIDLSQGTFAWQAVLGQYPELMAKGVPQTGTLNIGGSIATAGKLVFIGATCDERFRAFDSESGKVLWEHQLDAGAYATPCTYEVNGRQYVAVAAGGGGKPQTRSGDGFVAFALE